MQLYGLPTILDVFRFYGDVIVSVRPGLLVHKAKSVCCKGKWAKYGIWGSTKLGKKAKLWVLSFLYVEFKCTSWRCTFLFFWRRETVFFPVAENLPYSSRWCQKYFFEKICLEPQVTNITLKQLNTLCMCAHWYYCAHVRTDRVYYCPHFPTSSTQADFLFLSGSSDTWITARRKMENKSWWWNQLLDNQMFLSVWYMYTKLNSWNYWIFFSSSEREKQYHFEVKIAMLLHQLMQQFTRGCVFVLAVAMDSYSKEIKLGCLKIKTTWISSLPMKNRKKNQI